MGLDVNRFETDTPEFLICPVCLDAATNPYTVCHHEHVLCEDCALGVETTSREEDVASTCPTCRAPFRPRLSLVLRRALEGYKIKCEKAKEGCGWTGSISDERKHAANECDHRQVNCPTCAKELIAKSLPFHLERVCPLARMTCPRGGRDCGGIPANGLYLRKDTPAHEARCGEYLCTLGCGTRTTLHRFKDHHAVCAALQKSRSSFWHALQASNAEVIRLRTQVASLSAANVSAAAKKVETEVKVGTSAADSQVKDAASSPSPPQQQQPVPPTALTSALAHSYNPFHTIKAPFLAGKALPASLKEVVSATEEEKEKEGEEGDLTNGEDEYYDYDEEDEDETDDDEGDSDCGSSISDRTVAYSSQRILNALTQQPAPPTPPSKKRAATDEEQQSPLLGAKRTRTT